MGKDSAGWWSWCFERGLVPAQAAGVGRCPALLKAHCCTDSQQPVHTPSLGLGLDCPSLLCPLLYPSWPHLEPSTQGCWGQDKWLPWLTLGLKVALQDGPHGSIKPPS